MKPLVRGLLRLSSESLNSASCVDASSEKILSCSQDYRAYLESFEEQCDESLAPQVVSMRLTWHLAEIFLLGPQETMLPELVGWLQVRVYHTYMSWISVNK
jgi:hypothetical protein